MAAPDVHELTGAYAVDALPERERRSFEEHLEGCADCLEEVGTLRETVAALGAAAAVLPPPALRARVLAAVALTGQDRADPRQVLAPPRQARRWPLAVAACLALLLAFALGGVGWVQYQRAEDARQFAVAAEQREEQARQTAERIEQIAANPDAVRVSGPATGGGQITVLVAGAEGVVITAGVPALPESQTYQLWFVRDGGAAITSAGLGPAGADAAGTWGRFVSGVQAGDTVAVSVEPRGGSAQPSTTPIVLLET